MAGRWIEDPVTGVRFSPSPLLFRDRLTAGPQFLKLLI